jgi:hypothetical protein
MQPKSQQKGKILTLVGQQAINHYQHKTINQLSTNCLKIGKVACAGYQKYGKG